MCSICCRKRWGKKTKNSKSFEDNADTFNPHAIQHYNVFKINIQSHSIHRFVWIVNSTLLPSCYYHVYLLQRWTDGENSIRHTENCLSSGKGKPFVCDSSS